MSSMMRPGVVAILCVLTLSVGLTAGEPEFGSKDFYPSPDRPIGYRGDGNGYFPGATVVAEWHEGTPEKKTRQYTDKRGRHRDGEYWAFADAKSKNIVWKTEMPSWVNGQPIVVGDKVFTYGEPDRLICVDARTGKVLWTRIVNPWANTPRGQTAADTARSMYLAKMAMDKFIQLQFHFGTCGRYLSKETYLPMLEVFLKEELPRIVGRLKELDAQTDWDAVAKKDIALLEDYRANFTSEWKPCWKLEKKVTNLTKKIEHRVKQISGMDVPMNHPWGNMVGWNMSTPISDGKSVYVQMGQGQTACFDMEGKLLWQRFFEQGKVSTHHVLSPLLADGVLVDMHGSSTLRGLDAKTGETLWEASTSKADKSKRGGYYVASHKIMTIGGTKYVVTSQCNIIRAKDGKVVGDYDYGPAYGGGAPIAGTNGIIIKCANGDGWGEPFKAFRLKPGGDGLVKATKLWEGKGNSGYQSRIVTPSRAYLFGRDGIIRDLASGDIVAKHRGLGGEFRILAGDRLISREGGSGHRFHSSWSHRRFDGQVVMPFTVSDVSDPSKVKTLHVNLLGGENQPRLPEVEALLPTLWKHPEFYNAMGGRPAHGVHTDTCSMPSGNRLFIRTVSHLYCIGDPSEEYDWNPASR